MYEKFRWGKDSSQKEATIVEMKGKERRQKGAEVEGLRVTKERDREREDRLGENKFCPMGAAYPTVQFLTVVTGITSLT